MSCRVVVLGAAGYLGRHLTQAAQQEGHRVTAVARRAAPGRTSAGLALCDAADRTSLLRMASGADCVINAVRSDPDTTLMVASNLRGLLQNAAIGQVLHVSSLQTYGQQCGVLHEGIVPVPAWGNRQAQALLQAEILVAPDDRFGARAVVIRPGCIYGPGAPVWVDAILRLLLARRLGWLGRNGQGACLMIHVQDLAQAIMRTIGRAVSGTYNFTAPDGLTWNDFFFLMASLVGALPLRRIGPADINAEIWLGPGRRMLAAQTGRSAPDIVTAAMARSFRNQARIVSVRAPLLEAAAFRPLRDGSREAAEAFLRQGTHRASVRQSQVLMPSAAAS